MVKEYIIESDVVKEKKDIIISVSGAKNSALPILIATTSLSSKVILNNIPKIEDVKILIKIIISLGGKISWRNKFLEVDCRNITKKQIPSILTKKIRSSILFLGPLTVKQGSVSIDLPGGCDLGTRPIDIHLDGLKSFGIKLIKDGNKIYSQKLNLKPADYRLKFPSVGATEHLLLTAILIKGKTTLHNVSIEPEVLDLIKFLKLAGAKISRYKRTITIIGGNNLTINHYKIIPDRIVAATWITAAIIKNKNIKLLRFPKELLEDFLSVLKEIGVNIKYSSNSIIIQSSNKLTPFNITTGPFPNFSTDIQPLMALIASTIKNKSTIKETIYKNRFEYAKELKKLGVNIAIEENILTINSEKNLIGTTLTGKDIRGTATLGLASLISKGKTRLKGLGFIDRAYEDFDKLLESFGATVKREI